MGSITSSANLSATVGINALDAGSGTLTGITQKISAFPSLLANPTSALTTQTTDGGLKGADDQDIDKYGQGRTQYEFTS